MWLCQSTRFTKTLLAHITFVRFLVRVNTHVAFQSTRFTKTLLAHITFVRSLVRVNTHVSGQIWMDYQTPSRKHRTRVALSFSSLLSSSSSFLFVSHCAAHHQVFANTTTPVLVLLPLPLLTLSSSAALATTTVFAFSARFGCLFFRLEDIILCVMRGKQKYVFSPLFCDEIRH